MLNKAIVKVSESKKDLDIVVALRLRPFLNSFNSTNIYLYAYYTYNEMKELNFLSREGIL